MAKCIRVRWTRRLLNTCMREGKIPEEWRTGFVVPVWKRKGDVHEPGGTVEYGSGIHRP